MQPDVVRCKACFERATELCRSGLAKNIRWSQPRDIRDSRIAICTESKISLVKGEQGCSVPCQKREVVVSIRSRPRKSGVPTAGWCQRLISGLSQFPGTRGNQRIAGTQFRRKTIEGQLSLYPSCPRRPADAHRPQASAHRTCAAHPCLISVVCAAVPEGKLRDDVHHCVYSLISVPL